MKINILHLTDGAREARGLAVIIDVFRAFTTACFIYGNNADRIIPVGDLDLAYSLQKSNPGSVLIGERQGKILPGFDYGNSPTQVRDVDFRGKTVILTTSAGTQGIVNAAGAEEVITGSFVNAGAIITYIRNRRPSELSLVCMGFEALRPTEEDTLLAEYIKAEVEGRSVDLQAGRDLIRRTSGRRFFDPANHESEPSSDFDLCLELDRFDFVLRVEPLLTTEVSGQVELGRIKI
jgi:2-phosphosulfolactate phosphatase